MSAAHLKQPAPADAAMRPEFVPGCSGKVRHTRQAATAILLRRRAGQIYPCAHCSGWHTTGVPVTVPHRKGPAP